MRKRVLALLIALAMLLSVSALAETAAELPADAPAPDERTLFLAGLEEAIESCDPSRQTLRASIASGDEAYSLQLSPTENGLQLGAYAGDALQAALEIGEETLWILYEGQTFEVPYTLFTSLAQGIGTAGDADLLTGLVTKYQGPLTAWAMKAWTLLSPMISVSDPSEAPLHIHINGDARRLLTAVADLVDEIMADTDTLSALLADLEPLLASMGQEEPLPDAAQLQESWKQARVDLLKTPADASLTMDAYIQPNSGVVDLSGTVYANEEELDFTALLSPGSYLGAFTFTSALSGSALDGARIDTKLTRVLSNTGNAAIRGQSYTTDGSLTVTDSYGYISSVVLQMTEVMTGYTRNERRMNVYSGTVKLFQDGRPRGTADFGLTIGPESVVLRLSSQDRNDYVTGLRVYADPTRLEAHLTTYEVTASLDVNMTQNGVPTGFRFYTAESGGYGPFTEVICDGEKLIWRDDSQEFLAWVEYPSADHMALLITRTDWYTAEPETARVDVTLPGGEDDCLVRITVTDVYGSESMRGEWTAVPAAPIPSLEKNEQKLLLDQDTVMLLLQSAFAPQEPAYSGETAP